MYRNGLGAGGLNVNVNIGPLDTAFPFSGFNPLVPKYTQLRKISIHKKLYFVTYCESYL